MDRDLQTELINRIIDAVKKHTDNDRDSLAEIIGCLETAKLHIMLNQFCPNASQSRTRRRIF